MRVKLAARGGGRWQSSGGYRSKFGLTVGEILRGLEELKTRGMEDCFQLLHFHLGSQIPNIRIVKGALNEAARVYVELVKAGAGLKYMDVGGGLGVDYDGSQTNFESSVNYTLQEYANDVVYHLQTVCDEAKVPHPTIISESGRAIVAHHSVLVFNVLGVSGFGEETDAARRRDAETGAAAHRPDRDPRRPDVEKCARELSRRPAGARHGDERCSRRVSAARAALARGERLLGDLPEAAELLQTMDEVPEDLQNLDESLSDTYFCNFSLFQSIPDSWAHQAALSDHADSPPQRTADAPRGARRHHLRFGREDRSVHRSARRQEAPCRCTPSTDRPITSGRFSSVRTRRSSAICTTCSETLMRST